MLVLDEEQYFTLVAWGFINQVLLTKVSCPVIIQHMR